MIRWYDYFLAVIVADLIIAHVIMIIIGPFFWTSILGFFGLFGSFSLWYYYCDFRKSREDNVGKKK